MLVADAVFCTSCIIRVIPSTEGISCSILSRSTRTLSRRGIYYLVLGRCWMLTVAAVTSHPATGGVEVLIICFLFGWWPAAPPLLARHATGTPPLLAMPQVRHPYWPCHRYTTPIGQCFFAEEPPLEATVIIQRPGRRRKGVHWLPPPPRGVH